MFPGGDRLGWGCLQSGATCSGSGGQRGGAGAVQPEQEPAQAVSLLPWPTSLPAGPWVCSFLGQPLPLELQKLGGGVCLPRTEAAWPGGLGPIPLSPLRSCEALGSKAEQVVSKGQRPHHALDPVGWGHPSLDPRRGPHCLAEWSLLSSFLWGGAGAGVLSPGDRDSQF